MKNINHEELNKLIKVYYSSADSKNKKIPLIVYGKYGVGKSAVIYETARQLANEKNKDFVDWNRITQQEKEVLIKNPENKFVFVDVRLAEMDIGDFKLPDFKKDEDYFIFKSTNWAKLLTNPKSDGILFFDELTLATPVILSSVYKIIYDRVFNEDKISDEWFIMGAGNTSCLLGDTLILGSNKNIQMFKKGDVVYNVMGKEQKVVETYESDYKGNLFTIKPRGLFPIKATTEHPFLVVPYKDKDIRTKRHNKKISTTIKDLKKEEWVSSSELYRRMELNEKFLVVSPKIKGEFGGKKQICIPLKKYCSKKDKNKSMKKRGFGTMFRLNKDTAWLLGLYVAEGFSSNNHICFGLHKEETYLEDRIRKIVKNEFGFSVNKSLSKKGNGMTIYFSSQTLRKAFEDWCGKYAENKKIPSFIMEYKHSGVVGSFLKGYFDGDGCFNKKTRTLSCASTSKLLITQIQLLLMKWDILMGVSTRKAHKTTIKGKEVFCRESYSLSTNNEKLSSWLGYIKEDIRKPRHSFYVIQKDRLLIPISNITKEKYNGKVYNLETEDNTYLVNNLISHNCDNAYTHDLPSPIRDRGGEVMLTPSSLRNWVDNYALKHNISSKIITFLEWKPSYLHKVEENEEQKSTTERGWERLNTLLQNAKTQDEFELISGSAINEGIAREFSAFLKLQKSVDLNAIVRNPEKIVELKKDIGLLYFFVSAVSERYWDKKEKEITFNKIMDFSEVLDKNDCVDFVVLLWKMCAKERKFYSDYLACKEMNRALKDKYFRYLGIE